MTAANRAATLRYSCDPHRCDYERSVRCILVFVTVDEDGVPTEVPTWTPETDEDLRLQEYAERILQLRWHP